METIQDLKYYTVTTDLQELKKEREEAELGELDDEDLQPYLGKLTLTFFLFEALLKGV